MLTSYNTSTLRSQIEEELNTEKQGTEISIDIENKLQAKMSKPGETHFGPPGRIM